ncbi:MAG: amidohydrolase family protein [Bryobacteraceae bacterium]
MRRRALIGSLAGALATRGQETKFGVRVQPGPMDEIRVKDYAPESSLVVDEHHPAKARFPAIDVHTHTSMNNIRTPADVDAWVKTMDEVGVERSIVFTGATGAEFDRQAKLFGAHKSRLIPWCAIDMRGQEDAGWTQRAVRELERCHKMGARGAGELTDKGWGLQGSERGALPRNRRLHLDHARLAPFWERCGELGLPVNIHIADHPSCWRPLGPHQERTPDFQHFNLSGKDVPGYEELLATRDRAVAAHPKTIFVFCHLSNQANDLAKLAAFLDRHPNAHLDIAARDYELGRQPRGSGKFIERYRARLLWGTDMGSDAAMYRGWWRLLETADEYIPGRLWWRHYGLELPEASLKALYRDNALRLLNWEA